MDAKILEHRVVYDRWMTLMEVVLRLPNGAIEPRAIDDHGSAAAVLLYNVERRVALLIKQPRAPVLWTNSAALLEVVAGRLDGKSGEETARAEAFEEAGVEIRSIEKVATLWSMPAVSTERLELFLAEYVDKDRTGSGGGSEYENECIEVVEIPLSEIWGMAMSDQVQDGKTFTLLQSLMLRKPRLFD